jgi:hypothetical protein
MVNDASSGKGRRLAPAGDGSAEYAGKVPHGSPSSLTQELAQLLAASIAQNQANRLVPSAIPTNAELTSLAQLVSAASGQRTLAPVFKDGLSALSYTRPQSRQVASEMAPEMPPDDEPMPIPSTWRQPVASDDQRWYRQQMGAALLGLIAGLMIVVPSVLWLSGRIGPSKIDASVERPYGAGGERPYAAGGETRVSEIKTVRTQVQPIEKRVESAVQYVAGREDSRQRHTAEQQATPPGTAERLAEARRVEEILEQATRRVTGGDVRGARELLTAAEDGAQGPVTFALAETYDPNMLAAWGSRGITSDVVKAKALYRKALDLGIERAHVRLEALQ